jgi:hypothetical protein
VSYYEQMTAVGDGDRFAYLNGTPEFTEALAALQAQFGELDPTGWYSLTTPQFNSVLGTRVVSAVMRSMPVYLDSLDPVVAALKFFVDRGQIYNKVYTFVNPNEQPLPYPAGALPIAVGFLVRVFGQPTGDDLSRYRCLYFSHPDHAAVETWARQSLPRGLYSTYYAATFDTQDGNRMLRMKVYRYDEQNQSSDWEVAWTQVAKNRGVFDDYLGPN